MIRALVISAAVALHLFSCRIPAGAQVRLAFTGDIIMHIPVKLSAQSHNRRDPATRRSLNNGGYDVLFERVSPVFAGFDAVVGNMEFPLLPPYESKPWVFNAPPAALDALKNAGFTMLHLANNHILDQGTAGVRHTLTLLTDRGLDALGVGPDAETARAGIVKEFSGIRVGFLGYAGYLNNTIARSGRGYHLNWLPDRERVREDITAMRSRCDYLVVVAHTGAEYEREPSAEVRSRLRALVHEGADLVIGHHPHVLQAAEVIDAGGGRRAHIFYSLGNFISNQGRDAGLPAATQESVIVTLCLERRGGAIVPHFGLVPVITVNRWDPSTRRHIIQVVPLADEIAAQRALAPRTRDVARQALSLHLLSLEQRLHAIVRTVTGGRDLPGVSPDFTVWRRDDAAKKTD